MDYDLKYFKKKLNKEYDKHKKTGGTQATLAKAIGISLAQLQRHLDTVNENYPSFASCAKYCKYFNCEIEHLFGMKATTHDMQYICDETGLSQDTVEMLQELPKGILLLLECLLNNSDLLEIIYDYVTVDVKRKGLPTLEPYDYDAGTFKITNLHSIKLPKNLSDKEISYQNDLARRMYLDKIRDILNSVKRDNSEQQ